MRSDGDARTPEATGRGRGRASRGLDGWGTYLAFVVALMPIVVPIGTFQLGIVDAFNVVALAAFAVLLLSRRITLRAPFAAGAFVILVGSLIAVVNAVSPPASLLALFQDAYLYVWFVMLVSVLSVRGDLVGLRLAWTGIACIVAIIAIVGLIVVKGNTTLMGIVGPKGARATGTFSDPNMCADYLGMSFFILMSLGRHMARVLRWAIGALLLVAIVATKSNGGALSLFVGLLVWAAVRARTVRFPAPAIAGAALLAVSLVLSAWWMTTGLGVSNRQLEGLESHSFLARATHSSKGRLKIWTQLEQTLRKSPLGIGPGNSAWIQLTVEGRERPHSMNSKEAHSDYLAYMIERGPLALLALLFILWQAFAKVKTVWMRRVRAGTADRGTGALVAALAGALACSAVHSLTIERLHFRHFWLLLAIVCALAETTRAARVRPTADASPEQARTTEPLAVARA
jgi:O-antigen ligase